MNNLNAKIVAFVPGNPRSDVPSDKNYWIKFDDESEVQLPAWITCLVNPDATMMKVFYWPNLPRGQKVGGMLRFGDTRGSIIEMVKMFSIRKEMTDLVTKEESLKYYEKMFREFEQVV